MLLAIDSSTAQVGVALVDGERLAVESIWNSQVHHSIELAPAVQDLLRRAGAKISDVEAVVVAIGPGSFTALRVGLSLAKGIVLARNIPILGVPTLDVLAAGQPYTELPLAAVIQAGRARIALTWYKAEAGPVDAEGGSMEPSWIAQGEPIITTVDAFARSIAKRCLVAGELSSEDRQRLARKRVNVLLAPLTRCVRRPSVLGELGLRRLRAGQVDEASALAPIYLHTIEPTGA